jgi:hypothetical protein
MADAWKDAKKAGDRHLKEWKEENKDILDE